MKAILVDKQRHDELKRALKTYDINLEHKTEWSDDIELGEYSLVIVCPSTAVQLFELIRKKNLTRFNLAVIFDYTNDRFITSCMRLGCKDIIRKPYNPEITAKRLKHLAESESSGYSSVVLAKNEELCVTLEEYIDVEIKRANRGRTPLAFLAAGALNEGIGGSMSMGMDKGVSLEEVKAVTDIFRARLRDTDFVSYYKGFILMLLPYCNREQLDIVKRDLERSVNSLNLVFTKFLKDKFYEKPLQNEKEIIIDIIEKEYRKAVGATMVVRKTMSSG